MAKFITGEILEKTITDIFWEAQNTLLIVSPYIKLGDYFKKIFDKHTDNYKLHIIIVFGKNEGAVSKSMSKSDFDYFKKFLNVSIIFVPSLHAKYYGNESKGVITSINLYDYSFKNNIEFGVYSEVNMLSNFKTNSDQEAWQTCMNIANDNEAVFIKRPMYESKFLSILLGKKYIKSDVVHDTTDKFYANDRLKRDTGKIKTIADFPDELEVSTELSEKPTRNEFESNKSIVHGYCIRTGKEITFDQKKPMCDEALQNWSKFKNNEYPEKFCHFSGEEADGQTTFLRPILRKNWNKAKMVHKL